VQIQASVGRTGVKVDLDWDMSDEQVAAAIAVALSAVGAGFSIQCQ
jgi:hypothetical protein